MVGNQLVVGNKLVFGNRLVVGNQLVVGNELVVGNRLVVGYANSLLYFSLFSAHIDISLILFCKLAQNDLANQFTVYSIMKHNILSIYTRLISTFKEALSLSHDKTEPLSIKVEPVQTVG